jgi:hypothetical protein
LPAPRGEAAFCADDNVGAHASVTAAIETTADILVTGASPFMIQPAHGPWVPDGTCGIVRSMSEERTRKLIAFDDDTAAKLCRRFGKGDPAEEAGEKALALVEYQASSARTHGSAEPTHFRDPAIHA